MARTEPKTQSETKHELFKHSAAIQIENNITLLQRKTWNALLWNAYDELPEREVHHISVEKLLRLVGFDSHNQDYLKVATKAMLHCVVEWDILDKDGSPDWGATALLAQVRIKGGICTYAYSPELRQLLHNPSMYARLDLGLQRRFYSKYALALWELCADYLGAKRDYGETSWIPLDQFRKLMGLKNGEYSDFRDLSKRVIGCATTEINDVSDFRVTVEYQRRGRKIMALKFKIRRVALVSELATTQAPLFPELDDMPPVVKELRDAGLSLQDALEIWQQGFKFVDDAIRPATSGEDTDEAFMQYVREKIHLLKRRQATGKVDNSTGFLRVALKKNYANPEFVDVKKSRASLEKRQKKQQAEAQRQQLEDQRDVLRRACDDAVDTALLTWVESAPDVVEAAVSDALAATPVLRQLGSYCSDNSALENYRRSLPLRSMVKPALERYASASLQSVREPFAAQIATLEAQIAAL